MDVKEFERALKLGLGRTILHLQHHDSGPYRDIILHACLHNTTYDSQVEGLKTDYLMRILELTGEPAFYRRKILDAAASINQETENRDASQLVDLARAFAQRKDEEARKVIYDLFVRTGQDEDSFGATEIVEIDGLDGFLFVADRLGKIALHDPEYRAHDYLLYLVEELVGESAAKSTLDTARKTNPNVDTYLRLVEEYRDKGSSRRHITTGETTLSYPEIKQRIEAGMPEKYYNWGKNADESSLRQAAADLTKIQDPKHLMHYLSIFRHAAFPLDPRLLFPLIELEHDFIHFPARTFTALENVTHPAVREFALQLIENDRWVGRAVGLLNRNFKDDDWLVIEAVSQNQYDDQTYHSLQISVRDIFKDHPSEQATQTLLNVYEYGPCSFCREYIVEQLHSIDALPDRLREECCYDSNENIPELAKNGFIWDEK